jgi:hypothetical protein
LPELRPTAAAAACARKDASAPWQNSGRQAVLPRSTSACHKYRKADGVTKYWTHVMLAHTTRTHVMLPYIIGTSEQ